MKMSNNHHIELAWMTFAGILAFILFLQAVQYFL